MLLLTTRFKFFEKANCDINKFNPLFRIACRLHNLCVGAQPGLWKTLSRCIMKSTGPICMDIRKSLRLMLFLLAPLQGCALDRLCEYDLQYEAAALEISENENAGPLEDVTESSEESDVDHK